MSWVSKVDAYLLGLSTLCVLSTSLAAQGSNECAGAPLIPAAGRVPYNNSTAGDSSQPGCPIRRDVWFRWVAPAAGEYEVSSCNIPGMTRDTVIAVYEGTCSGSLLGCNDDYCGVQSRVTFAATKDVTYVIRIGQPMGGGGGAGSFQIQPLRPAVIDAALSTVNGRLYYLLEPSSWSRAEERAIELGGHLASVRNADENDWILANFFTPVGRRNIWIGLNDAANEDHFAWVNPADKFNSSTSWTNWHAGEPNNSPPNPPGEDYVHIWEDNAFGSWNDSKDVADATWVVRGLVEVSATPSSSFCSGDGMGAACPCGNFGAPGHGCANSVNPQGALLTSSGFASVEFDSFHLNGSGMPNGTALYFQGTAQSNGGLGSPFGDGLRCVTGSIVRLGIETNSMGASTFPSAGDLPIGFLGFSAPGDVRTYQTWYRNAAAFCTASGFNLSNGIQAVWTP